MSPKDTFRRYVDAVWNRRELDRFPEFVAPHVILHGQEGPPATYAAFRDATRAFLEAFPDVHVFVADAVEEGNKVAARVVIRGTNLGPFDGERATGRRVKVEGRPFCRVEGGRIVEFWSLVDEATLRAQLGQRRPAVAPVP